MPNLPKTPQETFKAHIHEGNVSEVKAMLENGAAEIIHGEGVYSPSGQGNTPSLYHTFYAKKNRYELGKLLLDRGANVNDRGAYGDLMIYHAACGSTHLDHDLCRLMLSRGVDPTLINHECDLEYLTLQGPLHDVSHPEIARMLLSHGYSLHLRLPREEKCLPLGNVLRKLDLMHKNRAAKDDFYFNLIEVARTFILKGSPTENLSKTVPSLKEFALKWGWVELLYLT